MAMKVQAISGTGKNYFLKIKKLKPLTLLYFTGKSIEMFYTTPTGSHNSYLPVYKY